MPLPEHWFQNVKKIYVIESVDYYSRKGSTKIFIHYKPWWKLRRKLKFTRIPRQGGEDQTGKRSPEAEAVIKRLKESLNVSVKKTPLIKKSSPLGLNAVLNRFADTPVLGAYARLSQKKQSIQDGASAVNVVGLEAGKGVTFDNASSVSMIFVTVRR